VAAAVAQPPGSLLRVRSAVGRDLGGSPRAKTERARSARRARGAASAGAPRRRERRPRPRPPARGGLLRPGCRRARRRDGTRRRVTAPLDGIHVLEFCHFLAGPYAGFVLADLGADVVKVEDPSHPDDARSMGPHFAGDQSLYFLALNSGKRSIGV